MKKIRKHFLTAAVAAAVICGSIFTGAPAAFASESGTNIASSASGTSDTEIKNGLVTDEKGRMFYYQNGKKQYGEQKVNGHWMYFTKKSGAIKNKLQYISKGSKLCYYDSNGWRASGTRTVKGVKCRFSSKTGNLGSGRTKLLQKYCSQAKSGRKFSFIGGAKISAAERRRLKRAVNAVQKGGRSVSFVMIDIRSGRGIAYNAGRKYYSASSIKGPFVVSVVAKKPGVLRSRKGTINKILKYSDNNAYIGFARRYGFSCFNKWVKKSGASYKRTGGNRCYGYFNARNMARIWLSNYSYFNSCGTGKKLGKMFEHPAVSAIHSTLGGKYTTRSKAGWIAAGGRFNVTNDAGIVYAKSGPYVVVLLSSVPSNMGRLKTLVRAVDHAHSQMMK